MYERLFSANTHGEIWAFVRYGYTDGLERDPVRGISRLVDELGDIYLEVRAGGGRFFVDDRGGFYKNRFSRLIPFVAFRVCG